MPKTISKEYLNEHKTENGAWTRAQMLVLGVRWPQPSGWIESIVGNELSDNDAARFEAAKGVFSKKTLRLKAKFEVMTYEAAGIEPPADLVEKAKPVVNIPPSTPKSIRRAKRREARRAHAKVQKEKALRNNASRSKSGPVKVFHPVGMMRAIDPNSPEFLWSYEWRRLRMQVLRHYGARCQCCGASPAEGAVMNVDHIKPRKFFPELAFDFDNLQVLCHECNHGKANNDQTDWRPEDVDHEVVSMLRSIANGQ